MLIAYIYKFPGVNSSMTETLIYVGVLILIVIIKLFFNGKSK